MEIITEKEFQQEQIEIFNSIFCSENPYGEPFCNRIKHKLLLFECVYQLEQAWIIPIIKTMKELNEDCYFVSILDHQINNKNSSPNHWKVGIKETEQNRVGFGPFETATYSINGTWGIICSYDGHAILGGPKIMIDNIINIIPDMDTRLVEFLELWKHYYKKNDKVNLYWIPKMLTHIYGNKFTRKLLTINDLGWLLEPGSE